MIYKGQSKKMLYRYKVINGNLVQAIKTYRGDKLVYQKHINKVFSIEPSSITINANDLNCQFILNGPKNISWSTVLE